MSQDWAEDVARLRDEADKSAQVFEKAQASIQPVTAKDSTGAISVLVDAGGLLQEVRVDASWRKSLEPAALAVAVQESISAAATVRTEEWAKSLSEQSREPEPTIRPMPSSGATLAARLAAITEGSTTVSNSATNTAQLEELLRMAEAISDGIDEVTSGLKTHLVTGYAGRSSSGHVRATVSGSGTIQELSFEQRWIEKAHHFNIGREATEAIQDAYRKLAGHGVQAIIDASPLGEFQALANNPEALAERLRLRE